MRTRVLGLAAVIASLFVLEKDAAAQQAPFEGKKFALQQFEPAQAGDRFFGVSDGSVGSKPLYLNLIGNYALNPLKLRDRANDTDKGYITSTQLYLHLNGTITFKKRFQLNADIPFALAQSGDNMENVGGASVPKPEGGKLADLRLGVRLAAVGRPLDPFALGIGFDAWLPTEDGEDLTSDTKPRFNPKLVISGKQGNLFYAYNMGVLIRTHQDLGTPEVGNAITFGAAAGIQILDGRLQVGPEIYGNTVLPKDNPSPPQGDGSANKLFGKHSTPVEAILGAKFRVNQIQVGGALGPGLTSTPGTPQLRALLSVGLIPEEIEAPEDRDKDGIADPMDACPDTPGIPDPDPKKNGCPPPPPPPDTDGDGIIDPQDACPTVPGVASPDPTKNGCPADQDGDGVVDAQDACPTVPGVANPDPAQNGCPPDKDGDGIPDAQDACVDVPGVKSDDPKKNGCPPDTDGDGIIDSKDACPNEPGVEDKDPAKNGCHHRAVVSSRTIELNEQVQFDTGKATIRPASDKLLSEIAQILRDNPDIELVSIDGHTDNVGNKAANKILSKNRAAAVVKWLSDKKKGGIDPKRLRSEGFGQDKPIADNSTEEGRQKNRRVEIRILRRKGDPK
ncbi:MAG: OmpA family protein [Myxococcales bacterium]|nr:OmpA family protein [Polyangiaceae bacterium]MDW8247669.1 OmpA family protein [Myxococcales bacterium]